MEFQNNASIWNFKMPLIKLANDIKIIDSSISKKHVCTYLESLLNFNKYVDILTEESYQVCLDILNEETDCDIYNNKNLIKFKQLIQGDKFIRKQYEEFSDMFLNIVNCSYQVKLSEYLTPNNIIKTLLLPVDVNLQKSLSIEKYDVKYTQVNKAGDILETGFFDVFHDKSSNISAYDYIIQNYFTSDEFDIVGTIIYDNTIQISFCEK